MGSAPSSSLPPTLDKVAAKALAGDQWGPQWEAKFDAHAGADGTITAAQLKEAVADGSRHFVVRIADDQAQASAGQTLRQHPFDGASRGRYTPMIWYWRETLDCERLVSSLQATLAHFPVLAGRYTAGTPTSFDLNNAGVPVELCTAASDATLAATATARLPAAVGHSQPAFFPRSAHVPFLPDGAMDPDTARPDYPLLKVKVTTFPASGGGGTAIGILLSHCVGDGEAEIFFMRCWGKAYSSPSSPPPSSSSSGSDAATEAAASAASAASPPLVFAPPPDHERMPEAQFHLSDAEAVSKAAMPGFMKQRVVPTNVPSVPEFAKVMPKIMGPAVVVVPMQPSALKALKTEASKGLEGGDFVSTDDALLAAVWRAQVVVRCRQLGIGDDDHETTTTSLSRAINVRGRLAPKLSEGFFANAATNACLDLTVKEALALPLSQIALRLRKKLQEVTPAAVAQAAQWQKQVQDTGDSKTTFIFDEHALTYIASSWMFDWEGCVFAAPDSDGGADESKGAAAAGDADTADGVSNDRGKPLCFEHGADESKGAAAAGDADTAVGTSNDRGKPLCFEHGALLPFVVVFTPRAKGDGIDVWSSGTQEAVEHFAELLLKTEGGR